MQDRSAGSDTDERRYAPAPTTSWTDVGVDLLIFDGDRGAYHALNATASAIWRELGTGRSADAVIDSLAARFDADREALSADVAAFLSGALASGLITEVA